MNYRGFRRHTVRLADHSLLVGPNNAGKSTIIEALRLLAAVTQRYRTLPYRKPPVWALDEIGFQKGVQPSIARMGLPAGALFHSYSDPPASITGIFSNSTRIEAYVGPGGFVHAIVRNRLGKAIQTKGAAASVNIPRVAVMPPLSAIEPREDLLADETIRRGEGTPLFSRHIRNHMGRSSEAVWTRFTELAESTWPGIKVHKPKQELDDDGPFFEWFVRDGAFEAEASWLGHGLQVWLQTCWFLAQNFDADCLILDEPEVHLHPDLQRQVYRVATKRAGQSVIATHSIEILSEAAAEGVVNVDKSLATSSPATDNNMVQTILDNIGTAHNIQLSRLWRGRRVLFVEGDDMTLLNEIHGILFPSARASLSSLPCLSVGGWGGWQRVVGSAALLVNQAGQRIKSHAIFDRDYHTDNEIGRRALQARELDIGLHVWRKKEIENYLLVPTAIARLAPSDDKRPSGEEVLEIILAACEALRESLEADVASHIQQEDFRQGNRKDLKTALREAKLRVSETWMQDATAMVSGKAVLARVSEELQARFGYNVSSRSIARALGADEIHIDIKHVLEAIEGRDGS